MNNSLLRGSIWLPLLFCFSLQAQIAPPAQVPANGSQDDDRPVSLKQIVPNILEDQKRIWLFPTKLTTDHNWIPTVSIGAAIAALGTLDPVEGNYFHTSSSFSGFNKVFSSSSTVLGTLVAPLSLYGVGLLRRDSKMEHTALLAGEAVADSEILTTVLKDIDRRARPSTIGPHGNYWDSWFDDRGSSIRGNGSFPSGHAIAAFSVATVIARRYRNHRWVPYVAYGLASAVGFFRLTLSAHFASDVFAGGAFAYVISRYAVLQP